MKKTLIGIALTLTVTTGITAEYIMKQNTGVKAEDFSSSTSVPTNDSNWADTVLLLKGEGNDGFQSFIDEKGHSLYTNDGVTTSTSDKYFGNSAIRFDGTQDRLSTEATTDFALADGDFTFETFVKRISKNRAWPRVVNSGNSEWGTNDSWTILAGHDGFGANQFHFAAYNYGTVAMLSSSTTIVDNTWYHIAITREGSDFRMFVNGILEDSFSWGGSLTSHGSVPLSFGYVLNPYDQEAAFNGYLDEIRLTKGVARYTSNFSIPTNEFPTE